MSLFWKEIDKTQMSKPPECAATFFWTWKSTLVGHLRLQKYIKSRWNTLYGKMGNCDTLPEKKSRDKHTFSIFHMLVHSIARANLNKSEKFLKTTTAAQKKQFLKILWRLTYFDAAVTFVTDFSLLFILALANGHTVGCFHQNIYSSWDTIYLIYLYQKA